MSHIYLVYRIKDSSRYSAELKTGNCYSTLAEAQANVKRGWSIKRIKLN